MQENQVLLDIKGLHASVEGNNILNGIDLRVNAGEVHAIMGPNGSGKSTLAQVLAGHPAFEVTKGSVNYKGKDLLEMEPEERARDGVFLAFQYPIEIPGVNNSTFLRSGVNEVRKHRGMDPLDSFEFLDLARQKSALVQLDQSLMDRPVNEGFSGGEKKRNEIFQMAMLEPDLAILDETDSGLDIDALRIVADGGEQPPRPGSFDADRYTLSAAAQLHRSGLRARAVSGQDREVGRQGACPPA